MGKGTLLLLNGRFHTLDPQAPLASAVAIRGGRIVHAGGEREAREALRRASEKAAKSGHALWTNTLALWAAHRTGLTGIHAAATIVGGKVVYEAL
jgi:predicted amidohydrolase YtcJ